MFTTARFLQVTAVLSRSRYLAGTILVLVFCVPAWSQPVAGSAKVTSPGGYEDLAIKAAQKGKVRVLVRTNAPFQPVADPSSEKAVRQRSSIGSSQDRLLASLAGAKLHGVHKYRHVPLLFMEVDEHALRGLLASPLVVQVHEDLPRLPVLDLSVPRIGAPGVWSSGFNGAGLAVAVLDTGVDKDHPLLSGSVVSEACYSSTVPADGATSLCPGGSSSSSAAGSALPYATTCPAGKCDHGTHVAGIIAGRQGVAGSPGPGVAPGVGVIAIQVFSRFENTDTTDYCGTSSPCVLSYSSDQIKALERVYELRFSHGVASVNMSLGGDLHTGPCDAEPEKLMIDNLKAAGVATIIAAGNNSSCGSISAPGCISSAVSVGATTDADGVASYSNSATFVTLLAPGSSIRSAIPGSGYATYNGTSMATPHVAGAWALLKQANPGATVNQILSGFTGTGLNVTDTKDQCTTVTKKRINVNEALILLSGAPGVQTIGATAVTTTDATLNASIDARNSSTTVSFEYGTTTSYGATVAGVPAIVTGTGVTAVSRTLAGLNPNTVYHFRVKGVSAAGTSYGDDLMFSTTGTCAALVNGDFEAGSLSPWSGSSTNFGTLLCSADTCGTGGVPPSAQPRTGTWWVWFGGTREPEVGTLAQSVVIPSGTTPRLEFYLWNGASSGNGSDDFVVTVDGQELFTTREGNDLFTGGYRLLGLDLSPFADGAAHTVGFRSSTTALSNFSLDDASISCVGGLFPAVTTGAATGVFSNRATLTGTVNAAGTTAAAFFDYGTTTAYGSSVAATPSPISGSVDVQVALSVAGLAAGGTYHYRLRGETAAGLAFGRDMTVSVCAAGARAGAGGIVHATLAAALNAALPGEVVKANNASFTEDIIIAGAGPIILSGGYDCGFSGNPDVTRIDGSITIGGTRSVTVSNVTIE